MKCLLLFIFLTLMANASGSAQEIFKESFLQRKQAAISELQNFVKRDTSRVDALLRVVTTATFSKEKQQVSGYLCEAMELSRDLKYMIGLANCFLQQAAYRKSLSDYKNALVYYDSALAITANAGDQRIPTIKGRALERKATIYYIQENYYTALDFYLEARKHIPKTELATRIRINEFITETYTILNNLPKAEEFALINAGLMKSIDNTVLRAVIYFSLVNVYLEKNDVKTAESYLDKVTPFIPFPKEVLMTFGYYIRKGRIAYLKGSYHDAYLQFSRAEKFAVAGGHPGSKNFILHHLAKTAIRVRMKTEAKKHVQDQMSIAETMHSRSAMVDALTNIAEYSSMVGQNKIANYYLQKSLIMKDSVMQENNLKQLHVLGALYEYGKQKDDISRLQKEREEKDLSVKEESFLNKIYLALILLLLLIGYLAFSSFRKGQKLARQQQDLQQQKIIELQKNEQLMSVEAMLRGQEEERSRVAKDLHDGLGSMLSGTKMSLMNLGQKLSLADDEKVLFDRSLKMLDNTMGDLRKVARNLVPGDLARFGLHEALRDLCDTIELSTGVKTVYQQVGEKRSLGNNADIYIYRIIQELVNNAVKHGRPQNIMVQLAHEENKIAITVEDDGQGFNVEAARHSKGAGQANINYRVRHFSGTYDITSAPGAGTSVNIELMM